MTQESDDRAPARAQPVFSAIAPGSLGLKAGFWSGKGGDPITFRPIIGWVTVMNFLDAGLDPFQSIVLNDRAYPLASYILPTFIGLFREAITPEEAWKEYSSWPKRHTEAGLRPSQLN
jgi:hypothetical protein